MIALIQRVTHARVRVDGAVIGVRGAYRGLYYDVFAGRPLSKPQGFETADVTAGFNLSLSF